ncbi:MAG: branched-chain amino acid ABC transporter permease [Candidatus Paceibacterota bacterium]
MITQLIFNSTVSGLLLALVALGFNLIFSTTKVFHIAHGAVYVGGAYCFWWLSNNGFPFWISILGSIIITALLAMILEYLVYRPLDKKKSGQAITLISSMGVYLFLVNLIALLFGNNSIILNTNLGSSISFLNLNIVPVQGVQLLVSTLLIGLFLWHTKAKWFLNVKAMISESTVASVMGVNTYAIRMYAVIVGSLLSVSASVLLLYDTGMSPHAGMGITLSAVVAVIIGGTDSFKGTLAASLLIAFLQTGTEWFFSAQWKEGITFLLLIAVILWRTEGIVSFNLRVEEQ